MNLLQNAVIYLDILLTVSINYYYYVIEMSLFADDVCKQETKKDKVLLYE